MIGWISRDTENTHIAGYYMACYVLETGCQTCDFKSERRRASQSDCCWFDGPTADADTYEGDGEAQIYAALVAVLSKTVYNLVKILEIIEM